MEAFRADAVLSHRTRPTSIPVVSASLRSHLQGCSLIHYCFLIALFHSAKLWHMLTCPAGDLNTKRKSQGVCAGISTIQSADFCGRSVPSVASPHCFLLGKQFVNCTPTCCLFTEIYFLCPYSFSTYTSLL